MYLDIGDQTLVRAQDIIGIFDLDITSQSPRTRAYLERAEKSGTVKYTDIYEIPKSFIVCAPRGQRGQTVYVSTLNSRTVAERLDNA